MYQKCPVCEGLGKIYNCVCDVCIGKKIISIETGLPPLNKTDKIDYIVKIDDNEYHSNMKIDGKLLVPSITEAEYIHFKNNQHKKDCEFRTFFDCGVLKGCTTVVSKIDKSLVILYDSYNT